MLVQTVGKNGERLDLSRVREAAEAGSRGAEAAISYAADNVGFAIANSATLLGVRSVVIGGDVVEQLGSLFFEAVKNAIRKYNGNFQEIYLSRGELGWRELLRSTSMLTLQRIIGIT